MVSFEWDDDCFNHTKSPSNSHLCISILCTFYRPLQAFHPKAKNFKVVDILYYYFCPIAWTVYGTQKVPAILPDPSIKWYVQYHLGYDLNFKAPTDVILVASAAFSTLMFAVCIKILNFQHR